LHDSPLPKGGKRSPLWIKKIEARLTPGKKKGISICRRKKSFQAPKNQKNSRRKAQGKRGGKGSLNVTSEKTLCATSTKGGDVTGRGRVLTDSQGSFTGGFP